MWDKKFVGIEINHSATLEEKQLESNKMVWVQ